MLSSCNWCKKQPMKFNVFKGRLQMGVCEGCRDLIKGMKQKDGSEPFLDTKGHLYFYKNGRKT